MDVPQIPDNETSRLNVLYQLNILDTKEEERFDRITRIAQKLFDVPIVLVSLIDVNRQWFKSCQGLGVKETSREVSFCGHTILKNKIMVIEDATKDKRFCDNPLVVGEPKIRFYIGCPLTIKGLYNVGTLCLIDRKSRTFSTVDLKILKDLAGMIQSELDSLNLSMTDELTGLYNRRGFFFIAEHLLTIFERNNRPFSILFFDLDEFKHINDTFGHAAGDELLKFFSNAILKVFRKSDVIARIGGDEFCVLLPDKAFDLKTLLRRLNAILSHYPKKGQLIKYSYGCIYYDKTKHLTIESLLEEADMEMYKFKPRDE